MWEICPKIISSQGEKIGVDSEIGHNGANRKIYVQKQATAEEIQEAMMRKMDIKKQKAGNISKIKGNQETSGRVYGRNWT